MPPKDTLATYLRALTPAGVLAWACTAAGDVVGRVLVYLRGRTRTAS